MGVRICLQTRWLCIGVAGPERRDVVVLYLRQGKTDDTPPKAAWLQAAFLLPKGKKRAEDGCSQPGGGV